jgi:small glutamine-rich tetratricopeptide repeat-containing protein alpha
MSQQQKLVLSIIDFLNKSIADGTVKQDDKESLEVAGKWASFELSRSQRFVVQCIGEAFGVDPSDQQQTEKLSIKPAGLQSIFDLFLKTRERVATSSQSSTSAAVPPTAKTPSAEDKATAEKHKQAGNAQMSAKKYDEAIDSYTKAIELDPSSPVYYSNRAAAYSSKGDNLSHLSAVVDAEKAIEVDSSFIKAYHRLGYVSNTQILASSNQLLDMLTIAWPITSPLLPLSKKGLQWSLQTQVFPQHLQMQKHGWLRMKMSLPGPHH